MDSQEATSNAIKSPSDRGESVVKTNTTLSPDIRTGTQGPIGSPRQPVNNGSVTKLRPGRPPVQIRFDSHSPGGLSGPTGQFVQQRPYGPIKPPPGGSFPRKPLQQSPNSPIVLNPCFAPSPVQRAGLQIGPRPPHPGNYQAQQFQGNVHRPQQPRLEYQNTRQQLRPELLQNTHQQPRLEFPNTRQQQPRPELRDIHQQAYNLESFARSPEIAQRQLKRNESWLNIPQQSLPSKREDKKSALPRPVVDKMANVDDSKKHQQIENTSSKVEIELSKNVENDDDDDVVMDGKKSPRTNDSVTCQKELAETKSSKQESTETVKRPETATINGKIDKPAAPKEAANEKVSDISADLNNKKSVEDSNVKECNDRLSSAKSQGKVEETSLDKVETLEESAKKLVDAVHQDYENEKLNKENARRLSTQAEVNSSTTSATKEDKTVTSDSKNASTEQSDKQSEKSDVEENEHKLNVSPTSPEKVHDTVPPTEQNGDNSQEPQTLFKYPDKSHVNTPAEQLKENQTEKEPETVSKPAEKLQESAPTNATKDEKQEEPQASPKKDEKEQEPKTSPKSLANSQIDENSSKSSESSPPKLDQNEDKQESKAPLKSPDKLPVSTPAEVNQSEKDSKVVTKSLNASEEKKAAETEKKENEDELNVEAEAVNALEASAPVEINETREEKKQSRDEHESKSEVKLSEDSSKKMAESENEEELNASSEKSEKSHTSTLAEVNENQKELESNESSKLTESSEKSKEKIPTDLKLSSQEKVSKDLSTSSTDKSTNLAKEAGEENIVENSHPDKHAQNVPESNVVSSANDSAVCEGNKTEKSPEEGVKGFDNGEQRSLVSPSQSPQSSFSPQLTKSSTDVEKLTDNEKKETVTVEKDDGKKTPESERLETCKIAVERVPTPAKMDERSEKKFSIPEIENGGVMNESAQSNAQPTTNGVADSPTKKSPSKSKDVDKRSTAESPIKSPSKSVKSLPRTPDTPSSTGGQEKKKLPMNKIQVGAAPSPNLKTVRSKIGSLDNASYKPGGGKVKIENRKLDFSKAQPKIAAKNEKYTPSGGDKKIAQVKLQWNAKPKVGSLDNATYKPGGGDKKIETVKLDFKDKAKPKVGSKDNAKHVPGGGSIKSSTTPPKTPQDTNNDIQTQKIDIKAESKIGSLDNVKHKPGGGDKKIFNDKDYLRQTGSNVESLNGSGSQVKSTEEIDPFTEQTKDDSPQPPPTTPTKAQNLSSQSSMVTPKAVRSSLAKSPETIGLKKGLSPSKILKVEDEIKRNLNSEDKNVTKDKIPKSPTASHSLDNLQLKSPENKTARSSISPHTFNNSELKDLEVEIAESPTSLSSPNSPLPKSPEHKTTNLPNPPRSSHGPQLKSPSKSSSHTSKKLSPKKLQLPKLAPSPTPQRTTAVSEAHAKINLPKLIERVAH